MALNILVSLLVNPGDVIMMTSALDLMRRKLPAGTRLGVLVRPGGAEILAGNSLADDIIIYPYRSGSALRGLAEVRRQIKAGAYDLFLSLDRRPRGAVAAFLAGIKDRVGPDILFAGAKAEFWTRLLFTRRVKMEPRECLGSLVEMFQLVVRRAFGLEGAGRVSLPPLSEEKKNWAAGVLPRAEGPTIGLCVRTNEPAKTWPAPGFAVLINKLAALSPALYITGGPDDVEYVEELLAPLKDAEVLNLAGKTKLMDIPALAAGSDLFISLDNATAHLAANSGLEKVICLLLATDRRILIDSMPRARYIDLAKLEERKSENQAELLEAEAELIFQAARDMLGGGSENDGPA